MPGPLSRRALLATVPAAALAGAVALPGSAYAQTTSIGAFRVVRARPGEPARPEIILPAGYRFLPGARYDVASRAEFYTFVEGPTSAGTEIEVYWPGVPVRAVIHLNTRLAIRHDPTDGHRFRFTLPVNRATADANQPTIQIWSHPDRSPGMYFKLDHNDPDRAAGPWTSVPWPANEARSQLHQLVAAHTVLRAAGLVDTAAAKGHRWFVAGFETNNTLHADNPPHWHISYNSGADFGSPSHNTHFWLNSDAENFYNGMDVTGLGRLRHYVGDPAHIYDFTGDANDGRGGLVATFTIREDGGLDIAPPDGPGYAIAAGQDGSLIDEVTVLRDGHPWLRVTTDDRYRHGVALIRVRGLQNPADTYAKVLRYDPLTGVLV
jgi:hypothetical protein